MASRPMPRGANVALTREIPNLAGVVIGVQVASVEQVLLDNLVFATLLCDATGKVRSDRDVVFFNQLSEPSMSVTQLTSALGGDRDQVEVDLTGVPEQVDRLVFVVYINPGRPVHRTLGQLRELVVRVLNLDGDGELVRSENLAGGLSTETGVVLAELYRHGPDWKFKVVGQGYANGIQAIAADFGVPL